MIYTFPSASSSRAANMRRMVFLLMAGIVLASLGLRTARNIVFTSRNMIALDDISYPECAVVERALEAARGRPVYDDPDRWPYPVAVYGPLTYYPVGIAVRLAGLKQERPDQARQIYLAGRFLSFAAGLAIVWWLWFMSGQAGLKKIWRLLAPLFFLSCPLVLKFWGAYRPDFPMVALSLWAWAIVLRRKTVSATIAGAIFMLLAVHFKHAAIFSAAALGAWLFLDGRRRDFFYYAGVLGLLLVATSGFLMFWTGGLWWGNTVRALQSPWRLRGAWEFLFSFQSLDLILLLGGLAAYLGVAQPRFKATGESSESAQTSSSPTTVLSIFRAARWGFTLAFLSAAFMLMRVGSDIYYYLETVCWGALLAGICVRLEMPVRKANHSAKYFPRPALLLIVCFLLVPALSSLETAARELRLFIRPAASWQKVHYELAWNLQKTQGEILLVEGYAWWFTQSPPTLMDPFLFSVRVAGGALSCDPLVEKIRRGDFELILLPWDLAQPSPAWQGVPTLPEPVLSAVREHYRLAVRAGPYFLYVPAMN